jgi:uncharacterized protein (DUF39 family)
MAKELYKYLDSANPPNEFYSDADDVEKGAENVKNFAAGHIVGELREGQAVAFQVNTAPPVWAGPALTSNP